MTIPKETGPESHREAASHFEKAAWHHRLAAKLHEEGDYEKEAHEASIARQHEISGGNAANKALGIQVKDQSNHILGMLLVCLLPLV